MNSSAMQWIWIVAVVFFLGCTDDNRSETVADSDIRFELGASFEKSTGYVWPAGGREEREFASIDRLVSISIRFPSGRSWDTASRLTFLSRDQGFLSEVVVHPLEAAATYQDVLAGLRDAVLELGVGGPEVKKRLDEWATSSPLWDPFSRKSFRCDVEPGINLFIEIKPAAATDKWFLLLDFTVSRHFDAATEDSNDAANLGSP